MRPRSMVWKGEGGLYKVLYSDPIESATVDVKMFLSHAIFARHCAYTLKAQPNMEILLVGSKQLLLYICTTQADKMGNRTALVGTGLKF